MADRRKKLAIAIRMIADGSKYLNRTCAECITFQWSEEGVEGIGKNSRKKYRTVQACLDAGAKPRARIPLTVILMPCWECPKIPDDAPAKSVTYAREISDLTLQTIQHFEECDAVGQFPNDAIVRRNAAIIRRAREDAKRAEHGKGLAYLMSVLAFGKG